jgi:multiple sugar transport system permease protein
MFAFVCVVAEMVLGIALALALEHPVRGMAFFRTLFILPMMIAPIAVGLTWRYLFDAQFGLINALLASVGCRAQTWLAEPTLAFIAIVVADIWQWTPFVFIMMIAGLANVDSAVHRGRAHRRRQLVAADLAGQAADGDARHRHHAADAPDRRLPRAGGVYVLTFGGPGDSTEILALHIYKTAFVGQRLGVAAAISVLLLVVVAALCVGRAQPVATR